MADIVIIYLSAAGDLELEREVLSRAITEIPTTLAWHILETPLNADEPDLEGLARSDMHFLLLGSDIRAPVGVEWALARRTGRLPMLYLKSSINRTQAAQGFERELSRYCKWQPYTDIANLKRRFLLYVTHHILGRSEFYKLSADEAAKLNTWQKTLKNSTQRKVDKTLGGAGNSSVILSIERYVPSDGVLLKEPSVPDANEDVEE